LFQCFNEIRCAHRAAYQAGLDESCDYLPGWLNAAFRRSNLGHRESLAVRGRALGFEQVRCLHTLQAEFDFDVAYDALRPLPVVRIAHDAAIKPYAAGCHMDVVAVRNDGVRLESHPLRPAGADA
jgi:hypothetical protein